MRAGHAIIVGSYLIGLGRPAQDDLQMLTDLQMPIKPRSTPCEQERSYRRIVHVPARPCGD